MPERSCCFDDWITPHYDFIPRLDKPAVFFGLVALAFKVFGLSEWAARLPSVLAAFGCLSLAYIVARSIFGRWAALWSVLILVTSIEFFALSRVVILDMVLTFFITLSLACFWFGHLATGPRRKFLVLLMYAFIGAATLVKGPIGLVLPAAVIFFYLLLSGKWALLGEMELSLGVPLFLIVAASWYVAVELRNPGYLHHFLYEENFARFTSTQFNRSGPWYYFIMVLAVGFFPWTALLPMTVADFRTRRPAQEHLFLILWIAVPFVVFSLSGSKLPHYILPLYPPLAILVGATVAKAFNAHLHENQLGCLVSGCYVFLRRIATGSLVSVVWFLAGSAPDPCLCRSAPSSDSVYCRRSGRARTWPRSYHERTLA